jgi:Xaa-Pro dipeptidase
MDRRSFVRLSAGATGAVAVRRPAFAGTEIASELAEHVAVEPQSAPPSITDDERRARIEKARRLMTDNGIAAMFLEGGTSLFY